MSAADNNTLLIAVSVPVGAVLAIAILILLVVLGYYCCAQRKLSDEPYAYRPLSDGSDGDEGLEEGGHDKALGGMGRGGRSRRNQKFNLYNNYICDI